MGHWLPVELLWDRAWAHSGHISLELVIKVRIQGSRWLLEWRPVILIIVKIVICGH
jgi:hypothetical protein